MKHVMMFVMTPELDVSVAEGVVEELKKVADDPCDEEGEDVVGGRVSSPATEGLTVARLGQLQGHRRADRGTHHSLHHLDNLVSDLLRTGILNTQNCRTNFLQSGLS